MRERSHEGNEMTEARARIEQSRARRGETGGASRREEAGPQGREEQTSTSVPNAYSRFMETVRNNPIPVAIAGGVLSLLVLGRALGKSKSSKGSGESSAVGEGGARKGIRSHLRR
jgi:hypothetical protein